MLDDRLQPAPIGVPGELHIGGIGLARGYHHRPDLTGEKFIPHPFDDTPGARLYKTGDLVRYRSDGNLEFLGRIDHQVKVRGFRIELGEIEAVLEQHPAIQLAAVLVREDEPGDKQLVGYITPADETVPDSRTLRDFLQERLPDYMIPSFFVTLDEMPLTPNGKVNRRDLPAPDEAGPDLMEFYVAPRTPEEEMLADIWQQVLGVEQVGIHDNFFELGGHSLLATQLAARLREVFQLEMPLPELFENPSVAQLAALIRTSSQQETALSAAPIEPVSRADDLPLSFAQQRLWFLDQLEPDSPYYNIPVAVRLIGLLNVDVVRKCLREIIRRHEILRTHFKAVDGRPVQIITSRMALPLPVIDLTDLPQAKQEAEAMRQANEEARQPFDLAQGPLLRAKLLRLKPNEHIALFTVHHIVSDV